MSYILKEANSERDAEINSKTRLKSRSVQIFDYIKVFRHCTQYLTHTEMSSEFKDWSTVNFYRVRHLNDDFF